MTYIRLVQAIIINMLNNMIVLSMEIKAGREGWGNVKPWLHSEGETGKDWQQHDLLLLLLACLCQYCIWKKGGIGACFNMSLSNLNAVNTEP